MATEQRLLTAEDLFKLPDDGYRYELLDGELVKMAPPGGEHGLVLFDVTLPLGNYVTAHDLGAVLVGGPGIVLRRNPDRVRAPDLCFIARDRIPAGGLPRGYLEVIPDLVVEVISPGDRAAEVQEKVEEWLTAGVRLVWALYPRTRSVAAYQSLTVVRVYTESDVLDGAPVLPGFSWPVASLFASAFRLPSERSGDPLS